MKNEIRSSLSHSLSRRDCLTGIAAAACGLAIPKIVHAGDQPALLSGKADHVISIWLGGGMGQIDTFDPKRKGDVRKKQQGSYYDAIDTAVPGVQVCEHLPRVAAVMDRVTAVRTLHHNVGEHAAASNRMHTGRPVSGTVTYPSLGSLVAHERGAASDIAPPYVLIGYPNVARGAGFLGASANYLYLTNTSEGPVGLSRPDGITLPRQNRRQALLAALRKDAPLQDDQSLHDYEAAIEQSIRLSGPQFNRVFELEREPADLRIQYGGEFGQRCLLSRRLVESGVRFVEVSHNLNFLNGVGWDVHNQGIIEQHKLIQELDVALSTLILDLEEKKLLDRTLIAVTTEFGRPAEFDSGGGRGHQQRAFSCVLAGGGLNHQGAWGETDEFSEKIISSPVGVSDLFATILASLKIDYRKNLYDGDRPIPITDGGHPIAELLI
ncbi:DUF1501 domain-containing protein [Blastopirellula sp. J2-11]|uniref:DUF1501 domain-containing protein n=1 Tax=Blastopirellula sp. J2-11 TaxID=2943192 RepID=UPI0021C8069C|nr:DUF1501 domain-containing protein [Blastopirellula sp. J2-11]UUO07170.1 DUF1501 domain-containing protein [Blastopirellula sp. J2-11]